MDLSIVSTMYESAPYLDEFYRRTCAAAEKVTQDYEIVLVNDGSPDDSLDVAIGLYENDPRVRVVDLSRNFGHHKAMMTGLAHASGDLVFLIDCDLEEDPELLGTFYDELKASGADVVYGVQESRKGDYWERISGNIFYTVFNALSSHPIPANVVVARLMTAPYVAALVDHKEREILIGGLWAATGFDQRAIPVQKHDKGKSTYDVPRKVSHLVNAITSFSSKPLVYIFYLGTFIMIVSVLAALYLVVRRLFFDTLLSGWPSLMVSIWFLGGLMIFCIGVIGIYLSKVFMEAKQRPYTIVKRIYDRRAEEGA